MSGWWTAPDLPESLATEVADLDAVFALQGERLTRDPLSEVIRIQHEGIRYYVKRYWAAGKGARRVIGRPRVKTEWQNLRLFTRWGIAVPTIMACGMQRKAGIFVRGALITREVENTEDMALLAKRGDPRLRNAAWVDAISRQLARATRIMHEHRFAHNDLKWRNLLVNTQDQLFLIDCPSGAFWMEPLLRYRIVKDLACLDKVAITVLSRTQRLRFYLQYRCVEKLSAADKRQILQILSFFEDEE